MLTIEVKAGAGEDIRDIIEDMCVLASRLGHMVVADLNGVRTMAKPGADPRELYVRWDEELGSKRPYKIVCGHTVDIPRDKPWDQPQVGANTSTCYPEPK